jgi:hypothetical protein
MLSEGIASAFLTSELDDEWLGSSQVCFTTGKRSPGTLWLGGSAGLRTNLDAVEMRIFSTPAGNRTGL